MRLPLEPLSPTPSHATVGSTTAHGYRPLSSTEKKGLTVDAVLETDLNDDGRLPHERIGYLQGLRGVVAIQMTLCCFFILFAPAVVTEFDLDGTLPAPFVELAPRWQSILRKLLSPLLWDGGLQAAFYIILSGRVVVQTFLERRTAPTIAGSGFRRPLRLFPPLLFAFLLVTLLVHTNAFSSASRLSSKLRSGYAEPPERWESLEQPVNAFLSLAFETTNSKMTRAAQFMPVRGTWWIFPRIFQQSFTIYVVSLLLPFTVRRWKLILLLLSLISTYWLGLFAWYSLTGLALAELVIVYNLPSHSLSPVPVLPRPNFLRRRPADGSRNGTRSSYTLPLIALPTLALLLGSLLKYASVLIPSLRDVDLLAHSSWTTAGLNTVHDVDPSKTAMPRLDDWLVVTSSLCLVEMSAKLRGALDKSVLRWWGRNSLLLFLLVPPVLLSFGSFLYVSASTVYPQASVATLLCLPFFVALPIALVIVELSYWLVEWPTLLGARAAWRWFKS